MVTGLRLESGILTEKGRNYAEILLSVDDESRKFAVEYLVKEVQKEPDTNKKAEKLIFIENLLSKFNIDLKKELERLKC
jgi:hypothetical protein